MYEPTSQNDLQFQMEGVVICNHTTIVNSTMSGKI
jgi:hypothetical protein